MEKVSYHVTAGVSVHRPTEADLNIERRIKESDRNLDFTQEQVAHYTLRYEDGEVMLIRDGEEIVYSEILIDDGEPLPNPMRATKRELVKRARQLGAPHSWANAVTKARLIEYIDQREETFQ